MLTTFWKFWGRCAFRSGNIQFINIHSPFPLVPTPCYKTPRLRRVSQWDRGEGPPIHRSADFCSGGRTPPLRIFAESHPGHCPEHGAVVRFPSFCVLLESTNARLMRGKGTTKKFLRRGGMSCCRYIPEILLVVKGKVFTNVRL